MVTTVDGVEMVVVPPGCFVMGEPDSRNRYTLPSTVCFDKAYLIDRYEVTNRVADLFPYQFSQLASDRQPDYARTNVAWNEAGAFCAARSGRLPTEAEWEYAARGPDALLYPQGNTDPGYTTAESYGARPIDTVSWDHTWTDAVDMLSNVEEWTSSLYTMYPYDATDGREDPTVYGDRVVRGVAGALWYRSGSAPDEWGYPLGFRCVIAEAQVQTDAPSAGNPATPAQAALAPTNTAAAPTAPVAQDVAVDLSADVEVADNELSRIVFKAPVDWSAQVNSGSALIASSSHAADSYFLEPTDRQLGMIMGAYTLGLAYGLNIQPGDAIRGIIDAIIQRSTALNTASVQVSETTLNGNPAVIVTAPGVQQLQTPFYPYVEQADFVLIGISINRFPIIFSATGLPGNLNYLLALTEAVAASTQVTSLSSSYDLATASPVPTTEISPTDMPITTLQIGGAAQVYTGDEGLKLRSGAGTNFQILENLPPGTVVLLLEGPVVSAGDNWWRVRAPSGNEGWVVEAANGIQALIPSAGEPPSVASPPTAVVTCPGSLPAQLIPGQQGYVSSETANNVRQAPGTSNPKVGQIQPGTSFTVLDGPTCADGYTWFKIDANGLIGWTAESGDGDYWIAPGDGEVF